MLKVANVSKSFSGSSVLRGMTVEVHPGEIVGVLGHNGAGKTTLLRLVAGLEETDGGSVSWQGQVWTNGHIQVPPWRRPIGMIFQQPTLWPHLNVLDHLELVLASAGLSRSVRRERCHRWLQSLALDKLEKRFPSELSGGQQSRVALARALVREPALLLLDEPFAPMDSENLVRAWAVIREFVQARGASALLVTQDHLWAKATLASIVNFDEPAA